MNKKLKIIFVGIPDMAFVCLANLLEKGFNVVGVVPPKKTHETYDFFKKIVLEKNLNLIEYDNTANDSSCIEKIKELNADIGVVCSFNNLLSKEFLKTTKMGYINCHPSLLPEYRGAAPYFHIVKNDEKISGVTLHFMDETFDTGDIIYQNKFELTPFETMGSIFNRTTYMLSDALVEVLNEIQKNGDIKRIPQQKNDSFVSAPKVDGNFRIRWNTNSAKEIECLIRACNPFYNAFTFFRGVNTKIIKAYSIEKEHNFPFGQIVHSAKDSIIISAKKGFVVPQILQVGTWGIFGVEEFYCTFSPKTTEFLS